MMVPKLTLQPLAENALYHGIKNKRGGGKILIEGEREGDDLILRVTDNGQGMTSERLYEIQGSDPYGRKSRFWSGSSCRTSSSILWRRLWSENRVGRRKRNGS